MNDTQAQRGKVSGHGVIIRAKQKKEEEPKKEEPKK